MIFPFGETVTLVSRVKSGADSFGNDTFTETPKPIPNVPVWPRDGNGNTGNELLQGQDTVIVGYSVFLPPGTVVTALDRVILRGESFEVSGEPGVYRSPFTGRNPGVLVNLSRVTG